MAVAVPPNHFAFNQNIFEGLSKVMAAIHNKHPKTGEIQLVLYFSSNLSFSLQRDLLWAAGLFVNWGPSFRKMLGIAVFLTHCAKQHHAETHRMTAFGTFRTRNRVAML